MSMKFIINEESQMKKSCQYCNKEILGMGNKFCSNQCHGKYRTKLKLENPKTKKCVLCNKPYTPCYKQQRYCTHECSVVANKGKRSLKVDRVCLNCNNVYEVHNFRKDTTKYCSPTCHDEYRRNRFFVKECPHCNKDFKTKKEGQKFCSAKCNSKSRQVRFYVEKECNVCKIKFTTNRESQKSCSHECGIVTMRLNRIKEINNRLENGHQLTPNYNPSSIPILEAKAKELGITDLQHAENGGEYYIKELGYWLDGYSKEKNIVFEYDEKHHFNEDGTYTERDIRRQTEIENLLGCKFIRIAD